MTYSFNLEWNELPEELQQAKIDGVIASWQAEDPTMFDVEGDWSEDLHIRDEAEESIESHFPLYF
jgi:hypothetical protein